MESLVVLAFVHIIERDLDDCDYNFWVLVANWEVEGFRHLPLSQELLRSKRKLLRIHRSHQPSVSEGGYGGSLRQFHFMSLEVQ
jgi:hypothetical protein